MADSEQTSIPSGDPAPRPGRCEFCDRQAGAAVEFKTSNGSGSGRFVHTCKSQECIDKAHRLAAVGVKLS